MKSTCPYCRKELDLMEVFQESDTSAIIQMLPSFGKSAHLVMGYCYLFGVSPMRLKAKKLRLLLEELKRLFDSESFTFERKLYAISHAGIAEALDAMIKRNFTRTLTNHNYLKQIMIGISEREGKTAGRRAEKDLRTREAAARAGHRDDQAQVLRDHGYQVTNESIEPPPATTRSMPRTFPLSDAELEQNRQRLKEMAKKIG